jgi:hypothetical protein
MSDDDYKSMMKFLSKELHAYDPLFGPEGLYVNTFALNLLLKSLTQSE